MTSEADYDRHTRIPAAAEWLAAQSPPPLPVLPVLRSRYGLTHEEAVAAVTEATLIKARAL